MSTANETISKLSEALNTLIGAYEELQKENDKLNTQVQELSQEKDELSLEKEQITMDKNNLQKDVSALSDNSNHQNDSMYSMLNKIESLLGNDMGNEEEKEEQLPSHSEEVLEAQLDEVIKESVSYENIDLNSNNSDNEHKEKEAPNTEEQSGKIDLNRMASLLNGFNK